MIISFTLTLPTSRREMWGCVVMMSSRARLRRVGKIASTRASWLDVEGDFAHAVERRDRTVGICACGPSCGVGIAAQNAMPTYRTMPCNHAFFATGTGMPATFRLTEPSMVRLVKNKVFQSLPPKPMFVVAGWPWTMRPSFLPLGSRM